MKEHSKITTMTSHEFEQDIVGARKAAENGPVFITDHNGPGHVLLSAADYASLKGGVAAPSTPLNLAEALADPNAHLYPDIDLNDYLPKREVEPMRFSFDEDE